MAKIARAKHDEDRAKKCEEFISAIDAYQKNVTPLWAAISAVAASRDGDNIPYPGDIFDFARKSEEPMWQTEAILKLGRMRYMGNVEVGDQRGANRIVKSMAEKESSDLAPGPKAAAQAAHELTVEKFRAIGGGS